MIPETNTNSRWILNSLRRKMLSVMINRKILNLRLVLRDKKLRLLWQRRLKNLAIINWHKFTRNRRPALKIGGLIINTDTPAFIIAEIGINHNGEIAKAKKLISAAARAGANAVKFQKRDLRATYTHSVIEHPELHDQTIRYTIPLLKEFELDETAYRELAEEARKQKLIFFATPFDEPSVDFLEEVIKPPVYKVASADLINTLLLEHRSEERRVGKE